MLVPDAAQHRQSAPTSRHAREVPETTRQPGPSLYSPSTPSAGAGSTGGQNEPTRGGGAGRTVAAGSRVVLRSLDSPAQAHARSAGSGCGRGLIEVRLGAAGRQGARVGKAPEHTAVAASTASTRTGPSPIPDGGGNGDNEDFVEVAPGLKGLSALALSQRPIERNDHD